MIKMCAMKKPQVSYKQILLKSAFSAEMNHKNLKVFPERLILIENILHLPFKRTHILLFKRKIRCGSV